MEPLPRFRLRQMAADPSVADADTIVLGGIGAPTGNITKDKVPYLGAIPWLGKYFQSTTTTKTRKNILVFINAHHHQSRRHPIPRGREKNKNVYRRGNEAGGRSALRFNT